MPTATATRYIVEKIDLHDAYGEGDERYDCATSEAAEVRWEDLTGQGRHESGEAVRTASIPNTIAEWIDPETGVEVIARRA